MDEWTKTIDKLPSDNTECGQANVIFCSPDWGWAIVGLFTNLGAIVEWAAYDQQNDKFFVWESDSPELWMYMPVVPPKG